MIQENQAIPFRFSKIEAAINSKFIARILLERVVLQTTRAVML